MLVGLGLAFLLEQLDRRIRRPEDLESIYRLPLLGTVPESKALSRAASVGKDGGSLVESEAFSLVRAHLRFFNIDRDLRTILMASAASGEGKTTIALHLAAAAARNGSHVLLLEMDLRQPALAHQLDLRPGPGIADVLIGTARMDEAAQSIDLGAVPGEPISGRTLDVLAAGSPVPPNPGALIDSHAMNAVLEQARSVYDLVVIDAPPPTAVSDAFPLLSKVDGVVVVGRVGHSRRDAAERLHQVLSSSGASVLGLIANGASSCEPHPYAPNADPPVASLVNGAPSSKALEPTRP